MRSCGGRDKRFGRGKKNRDGRADQKRRPKPRHIKIERVQFRTREDLLVAKLLQKYAYTFKYDGLKFEVTGRRPEPKQKKINGIQPCNELESRMIRLLIKLNIPFEFSKRFATIDKNGHPNSREVDIWFPVPIQIYWCDHPVQALELKSGHLDGDCWEQKKELKGAGVNTWMVLPQYMDFWERRAFLRRDDLPPKK